MTEAELINQQRKQIEELQNKLLDKNTGSANQLSGYAEMFKNMTGQMKPVMDILESAKKVISMKPNRLETIVINKNKCEVGLTENGTITIMFQDKNYGQSYYEKLIKK